ncbi:MAG: hypothetical protein VB118_10110 [Oscillospiraceae bacterium]|nr:hypothetical protein [Oscillospiraceae bacterium]
MFPKTAAECANEGIKLCGTVVSALFPFMVLSTVLISLGSENNRASGAPKAFLLGSICGFPIGGICVKELYKKGCFGKKEAEMLIPACNLCGPAFIFGVAGQAFPDIPSAGAALYAIQLICAGILFCFTYRKKHFKAVSGFTGGEKHEIKEPPGISAAFSAAVKEAAVNILYICGFVVFFSFLTGMLGSLGLKGILKTFICGLLEMTCGVKHASLSGTAGFVLTALFISFGGVSVICQTVSVISDTDLSIKKYIAVKAAMGITSAIIAACYAVICL